MPRYIDRLVLFESVRNDDIAIKIAGLNSGCTESDYDSCYSIERALVNNIGRGGISGNCLQDHFCRVIADEDNRFARLAEEGAYKGLWPGMTTEELESALSAAHLNFLSLAAREIKQIYPLYHFSFTSVDENIGLDITSSPAAEEGEYSGLELVHQAMVLDKGTDAAILLAGYYRGHGSGGFGASPALNAEEGGLTPARFPDPVTFDDLINSERHRLVLSENIEILLSGLTANNMLLYGDSGTGKSSAVKALLNLYSSRGLKLISIAKENFRLLPGVFEQIAGRGLKFIIFIDDLSFDENENEYKIFKSIIEGRIAPRPQNAVFIVTTNRKNIVKDIWEDREGGDIRRRDNMEEKRSLADRFGITLVFSAPTKQEYLAIVHGIAERAGLDMPDDELDAEALKWEIRHGRRTGRVARQFVDYMTGVRSAKPGGFE